MLSITQFPTMTCSVSAEGSLNCVAHSIRSFFFWLWANNFFLIGVHLLLVYHAAQLSHTWSDFSRSLKFITPETLLFVSLHSVFIIIDFDEAANMQCWHYFCCTYFWLGYLVGMTSSRSEEPTLVVFFT